MRRRPPRPSFVVTFSAAVAALATGCGGGVAATPTGGDGGTSRQPLPDGGTPGQPLPDGANGDCPSQAPAGGAPCDLPPSVDCSYQDQCGVEYVATCDLGRWNVPVTNPPAPVCPSAAPPSGTPCPCLLPTPLHCQYPAGSCAGQPQEEIATCNPGGTWQVSVASCNPPAVEAGVEDAATVDAGPVDGGGE